MSRSRNRKRRRHFEKLESRNLLAAAVINEILFDRILTTDGEESQYVELRGEPGKSLSEGTYLVTVHSRDTFNNAEGVVNGIFDLSGLSFGSNGFLVLLPQSSVFQPDSGATVVRSTSPGFGGLPGGRFVDSDPLQDSLPTVATSYFLIETSVAPQLGDDIDTNSDGFVDDTGVFSNWNVLDSITVVDPLADAHGYGAIVFAHTTGALFPEVTAPPTTPVIRPDGLGYVGRIGNSTGSTADDWVGGTVKDIENDEYFVRLGNDIHGRPKPIFLHGRELDHVGSENFVGAARLSFFEDVNGNGVFDSGDTPLEGASVFADSNNNGVRDQLETIIEPDNFTIGRELNNLTPGVTLSIAGTDNVIIGFEVTAKDVTSGSREDIAFAHTGIPFFSPIRKLRADFYRPASSASVDVIGNSDLTPTYGRLDAYDANGNLLQMVRTGPLAAGARQTLTITRATDEIAYTLAYSDDDFMDSSPFGRFDRYRFTVPEAMATSGSDGKATLNYLDPGDYTVYPLPSTLDNFIFNPPSFNITKYQNFEFDAFVSENLPPAIGDVELTIPENSPAQTLVGMIPATDHPSQTLTYTLVNGGDRFTLDSSTGALRVRQGAVLNFEAQSTFEIMVRVTDDAENPLSSTRSFQVELTDVNERPTLLTREVDTDENVANGTVLGVLNALDVDAGDNGLIGFRLVGTIPGQAVSINPATGELRVNNSSYFNFETRTQFVVSVEVFDQGSPSLSSRSDVTISLRDVNEAPRIVTEQLAVGELAEAGTVVGTIQVSDPDAGQTHTFHWAEGFVSEEFVLDEQSGELSVAEGANLSFAEKPLHTLELLVRDSGEPSLSATKSITVRLIDQNNPPTINDAELKVNENAASGTLVGTVTASDPDADQQLIFGIATSPGQSVFEIGQTNGEVRVRAGAKLDFEERSSWPLVVQVWDTGFPSGSTTKEFIVSIVDRNESPEIDETHALEVGENSGNGVELGAIPFSDPDAGDVPLISIVSGNDEAIFAIDSGTGMVTVNDGSKLNFEEKSKYFLGLQVSDGTSIPAIALLTVTIQDRNDRPEVVGTADPLTTVAGLEFELALPLDNVQDEDSGQTFTWRLAAAEGDLPDWMSFDPESVTISGLPWNEDAKSYALRLIATDNGVPPLSVDVPITFEVTVNATPWSNPELPLDVNADKLVSAIDALVIINYLNRSTSSRVDPLVDFRPAFLDVNANNLVEPLDALAIINFLNRSSNAGEGEASTLIGGGFIGGFDSPNQLDDLQRRRLQDQTLIDLAFAEFDE